MKDAIENDVSLEEDGDIAQQEPQREPTERDKRIAEIARQVNEMNGIKVDPVEQESAPAAEMAVEPVHDKAADPLQDLGYYRNASGELVTRMKINGEEREVPASQVKAYIQKDLAGDRKLQQAYEREQALIAHEQTLRAREAAMQQSFMAPKAHDDAQAAAKAVFDGVYDGDTEASAKALVEFLQRNQATVNPDQILAEAERRAVRVLEQREQERRQAEWAKSVDEGNRFLVDAHPEIYSDNNLFDMVNSKTARMVELMQRGDPEYATLTPKEIISRAATEVTAWLEGREVKAPVSDGGREARKASLKPIPRGMANPPPKPKAPEVDMSPEAIVARMRMGRAVQI